MKPTWSTPDGMIKLYRGDCREILPKIRIPNSTIITDPVWPGASLKIPGSNRPYGLFREFCQIIPKEVTRLIVQLGCTNDPRFMRPIPARLKYLRNVFLEYCVPQKKGRILFTGDVAYIYGPPVKFAKGRQLMPGRYRASGKNSKKWIKDHPCPRHLEHVAFLVERFTDKHETIIDPFMGGGTSGAAASGLGRPFVGIELPKYFDVAVGNIEDYLIQPDFLTTFTDD